MNVHWSCFPAGMEKAFAAAMDEIINAATAEKFMVRLFDKKGGLLELLDEIDGFKRM